MHATASAPAQSAESRFLDNGSDRNRTAAHQRGVACVAVALLVSSCQTNAESPFFASLKQCHLTNDAAEVLDAWCGTLPVHEDRTNPSSRTIDLAVAVIKATGRRSSPDPLFFLAGGPGQSAITTYPALHWAFARVNTTRDIVLVDQRGTGKSGRLACPDADVLGATADGDESLAVADRCRRQLEKTADLTKYTTAIAMDDLDDVRAALGYQTIDLYGGSYGTRAALVYARRHEEHVRALVVDGVAPPDWVLGSTFGSAGQRSLDGIFTRCAADAACDAKFPGLAKSLDTLLAAHDAPETLVVADPTSGVPKPVRVTRENLAGTIHGLTYESETSALLPLLVHTAAATGDLGPFAAQSLMLSSEMKIDVGQHLAVVCSEDVPFFDMAAIARDGEGTYLRDLTARRYVELCKGWPRAAVTPGDRAPLSSKLPVLLLSGELDPVTPPANAEHAKATLPNALALVVPGEGHGALLRGCTRHVVADFLDRASVVGLDAACVKETRPLRFFTRFAGPEP